MPMIISFINALVSIQGIFLFLFLLSLLDIINESINMIRKFMTDSTLKFFIHEVKNDVFVDSEES